MIHPRGANPLKIGPVKDFKNHLDRIFPLMQPNPELKNIYINFYFFLGLIFLVHPSPKFIHKVQILSETCQSLLLV